MAAQWPRVKGWLAAAIPTLPGLEDVLVYAGPPVAAGNSAPRYVTVGYTAGDKGGSYQIVQADGGIGWEEIGEVRTAIVAQAGDSDPSIAEADAFAVADAIDRVIRADHTLGGTLAAWGTAESIIEVDSIANPNGTATELVHVLRYTTTTT